MVTLVHDLTQQIFREGEVPQEMKEILIVPIYKKGKKSEWKNWRPHLSTL